MSAPRRAAPPYVRRRADLVAAGLALLGYLACAALAGRGTVPPAERALFRLVNDLPEAIAWIAYPVQLLGVLVLPLLPAAIAAVLRLWRLSLALVVIPVLKYAVEFGIVKQTVQRARPFESLCGGDPACAHFRGVPLHGPSFVSGHAIIAAAVATVLLPYLARRWQVVAIVLAAGVALARVYLGAHNPLDVVGGAAVGIVLGSLLNLALGVPARPAPRAGGAPRAG